MKTPVNFSTAKLLKEKGFDELCNNYTDKRDGDYFSDEKNIISYKNWNEQSNSWSRPTIADVVMWIYEKKGIWIEVFVDDDATFGYLISEVEKKSRIDYPIVRTFKTPTEAYLEAITYTLNHLI